MPVHCHFSTSDYDSWQSGLFTAVLATVASMLLQDLSPDPNDMTHALLLALLNTTSGLPATAPLPQWTGPSRSVVWVQSLLYASLACSLFAALGAVLGKQWLSYYRSIGEHGTLETRGKERHRKLLGVEAWRLRTILSFLPILLQASLILFGIALCAFMWTRQRTVAIVLMALGSCGAICYFYTILTSIWFPDSPFRTPLSDILIRLFIDINKPCSWFTLRLPWFSKRNEPDTGVRSHLGRSGDLEAQQSAVLENLTDHLHAAFMDLLHALDELITLFLGLPFRLCAKVLSYRHIRSVVTHPHDNPLSDDRLTARATKWLLDTSTDPLVHADALQVLSHVHWPHDMVEQLPLAALDNLLMAIAGCFQPDGRGGKLRIISSHQPDRVPALCGAFLFVYWEKYATNPKEVADWARTSGRAFVKEQPGFVDGLYDVAYSNAGSSGHGHEIIALMYVTVGPYFTDIPADNAISHNLLPASTPMETIAYCTTVCLSEAYLGQDWSPATSSSFLYAIGITYRRATHRTACDALFLSFAIGLEYELDCTVSTLSLDQ